jgi:hypothetical protein
VRARPARAWRAILALLGALACARGAAPETELADVALALPEGFRETRESALFPDEAPGNEVRFLRAVHDSGSEIDGTLAPDVPLSKSQFAAFADHFARNGPALFRALAIDGSKVVVEGGTPVLVVFFRTRDDRYAGAMLFRSYRGVAMRLILQTPREIDRALAIGMLDALVASVAALEDPA